MLKTRKVSIQAGQHNLHYVPGKRGLNRASLKRPRRNPLKCTRNKNFPGFWDIFIGRYVQQRETNSNRPHWKPFNEVLTSNYKKQNAGFSIIRDEEFANANKALDAKVKFLKKSGKGKKRNAVEKGLHIYTFCNHDLSLCSLYNTQSKIIFRSSLFVSFVSVSWLVLFSLRATRYNAWQNI